jgi:hypothetical protein
MSMRSRRVLVHQHVLETFGPDVHVPSSGTFRLVWREWFGAGGGRQRYLRSAASAGTSRAHVVVHRPGQVVALDTTPLPVKVRDGVFGDPVSAHLTLALDLFTHSVVAFRLTLVSDTSVDVAMLLRDVMMPVPMREGWGPDMEWPYPGIPADIVADFAGHRVAGLPFFAPETVTPTTGPSTRITPSWKRSGSSAATSCPPASCGPRTSTPSNVRSVRCGRCCSSNCPAIPGLTSPTGAPTRRATRCSRSRRWST